MVNLNLGINNLQRVFFQTSCLRNSEVTDQGLQTGYGNRNNHCQTEK